MTSITWEKIPGPLLLYHTTSDVKLGGAWEQGYYTLLEPYLLHPSCTCTCSTISQLTEPWCLVFTMVSSLLPRTSTKATIWLVDQTINKCPLPTCINLWRNVSRSETFLCLSSPLPSFCLSLFPFLLLSLLSFAPSILSPFFHSSHPSFRPSFFSSPPLFTSLPPQSLSPHPSPPFSIVNYHYCATIHSANLQS